MDGEKPRGLRISVTKRCNLECPYCHREGILDDGPEISLEKILSIVEAAKTLGIENVKITGGEPLLRDEIIDIVSGISGMGISDISLTVKSCHEVFDISVYLSLLALSYFLALACNDSLTSGTSSS